MKVLCAADLHLGRQPARLPGELRGDGAGHRLGPGEAWRRTVELAVTSGVDAVLLAGDVVEHDRDFFEAYADLHAGAERLADAGIPLWAVSGNHDINVLPRLADTVGGVRLLGRDGAWEGATLFDRSGPRLQVVGRSFAAETAPGDPLADPLPDLDPGLPAVGLLHADRDASGSRYAPVRSADLRAAPLQAWLLGHVHAPDALASQPRPIGYLGSLVGTDPGEPGPRGPWLLRLTEDGGVQMAHHPLAPLRWEDLPVAVDGLEDPQAIGAHVTAAVDALHTRLEREGHLPDAVGCRLRLTGRTPHRRGLRDALDGDDPRRAPPIQRDGVAYFVHAWHLQAQPAVDVQALAAGRDPPGAIARMLRTLRGEAGEEARRALLDEARERFRHVARNRHFAALGAPGPDDAEVAARLERAAYRTLDGLAQARTGRRE